MSTRTSSDVCTVLDAMGAQAGQGTSAEAHSTSDSVAPPLISTLEACRPNKFRRQKEGNKEARDN